MRMRPVGVAGGIALGCLTVFPAWAAFDVEALVKAAIWQSSYTKSYDGSYRRIAYPGGDVPRETGVCTDVIIRAYRTMGVDLQQRVNEDMKRHFAVYPKIWGLDAPDANIDHRRVPNLQVFFTRFGESLPISGEGKNFLPGDIVTWDIGIFWRRVIKGRTHIPHIGIVTGRKTPDGARPLIVHNIGYGVQVEDMLFDYPITGHYRYRLEITAEKGQ